MVTHNSKLQNCCKETQNYCDTIVNAKVAQKKMTTMTLRAPDVCRCFVQSLFRPKQASNIM